MSDPLNEREFELINIVGAKLAANQRDLSSQLKLSLGQTNILIRRLITKGYIRISQLNQRKVQYLLTPKGMAEKMRKSVKYTLKTINSIGLIKMYLKKTLQRLYDAGERNFYLLGQSDLVDLLEIVFKEMSLSGAHLFKLTDSLNIPQDGIVLICQEKALLKNEYRSMNMIEELAKANQVIYAA